MLLPAFQWHSNFPVADCTGHHLCAETLLAAVAQMSHLLSNSAGHAIHHQTMLAVLLQKILLGCGIKSAASICSSVGLVKKADALRHLMVGWP